MEGIRALAEEWREFALSIMKSLAPALFLDRDGVIHREIGYLSKPEQIEFLPGIFELCRSAQSKGYRILVITNQSGIARGFYSEDDFHALMHWLSERFAQEAIRLDGYYFCPHHPEFGVGQYRRDCEDRKPNPGMILQAAREHWIDLENSIFVGDRYSDLIAGAAAGIGRLVLIAGTESSVIHNLPDHLVVHSLSEVQACLNESSP
jgi:D-glycero-D-manno-heptose 1,7-bisphosphate phosphatase